MKPGNILLGPYGETLVVDWGLAKVIGRPEEHASTAEGTLRVTSGETAAPTQTGAVVGTPAFMSPEQAAGKMKELGPASDVYSLGATLYCLLTGRPAFERRNVYEVLEQISKGDFPPPRRIKPGIAKGLEAICLKAMALKPGNRYASPRELAEDIEHWLADEPVSAWPEPLTVRTRRWAGRHRVLLTSGAAAAVVAAILLGATTLLLQEANLREQQARRKADSKTQEAREQKAVVEEQRTEALLQRNQVRRSFYGSTINQAQRAWDENQISRLQELLADCQPKEPGEEDLRSFEWYYFKHLCNLELREFKGHTHGVTSVAFSPDGKRLASSSVDNTVRLWDADSGRELLTLKGHTEPVFSVAFSADGKRLASASDDHTVRLWDAESGRELLTLKGHTKLVFSVVFSPDGKRLASASVDNTVRLWDAASGRELLTLKVHTDDVSSVAFSPDGKRLAAGGGYETIVLWETNSPSAEPPKK